jgi:glycosyltransferase involved in cell wall biosynthesis
MFIKKSIKIRENKKKFKILAIGSIPPPIHGSTVYFSNFLNSSIKEVYYLIHFDISDHRSIDNLSKFDFINVFLAIKQIISLFFKLLKEKPDLIYISPAANFLPYFRDGIFIAMSYYFSKAKIVIHQHAGSYFRDYFYEKSNKFIKYLIKHTLNKVDEAIVVGEKLKYIFEGLVKNINFVWNGTDFDPYKNNNELPEKLSKPKSKVTISYLGNLIESKGVMDIVYSIKKVIEKHKNVIFKFAGPWFKQEPELKNKIYNFINENKLDRYIFFKEGINGKEKEEFFKETDIFVFPTYYKYESFGIVNIEAMSAYCPVISTKDIGAIPEVISNGESGILVEKNNPEDLAIAINYLIENPEIRKKMGIAGRKRFEKYFTIDKNIKKMITIFESLLKNEYNN